MRGSSTRNPQTVIQRRTSVSSSSSGVPASTTRPRSITAMPAGKLDCEVEVLLDQHDRHVPLVAQPGDRPADVLDDRRLDALGRLVHQEELRPRHHRPPDRELLLLPARQVAAAPAHHLGEHREQLEDRVGNLALAPRQQREPGLEVLAHRQQREDLASLRHRRDPEPGPGVGPEPGDVLALPGDPPAADPLPPGDRPHQRGLADAVAPEDAGDLPRLGGHRDVLQRLRRAVVEVDVLDVQHVSAPDRPRSPRDWPRRGRATPRPAPSPGAAPSPCSRAPARTPCRAR